jgi:hypothetical protein
MDKVTFTKARWVYTNDGRLGNVETEDGEQIAMAQPRVPAGRPDPEREANARLIAASPDLLFAVAGMLATWGSDDEEAIVESRDRARRAIEKAIGESLA